MLAFALFSTNLARWRSCSWEYCLKVLQKIRQCWRIRPVNHVIYEERSYNIYQFKAIYLAGGIKKTNQKTVGACHFFACLPAVTKVELQFFGCGTRIRWQPSVKTNNKVCFYNHNNITIKVNYSSNFLFLLTISGFIFLASGLVLA